MRVRALPMSRDITLERMTGIEPAFSAWEADVLPLNYIRSGPFGWAAHRAACWPGIRNASASRPLLSPGARHVRSPVSRGHDGAVDAR